MNIKLSLYQHATKVKDYILNGTALVIGRSDDADIRLNDRWVSRKHCCVEVDNGVLRVRDLGSRHGTIVNDELIEETTLQPGDSLHVGLSRFVASIDESAFPNDSLQVALD